MNYVTKALRHLLTGQTNSRNAFRRENLRYRFTLRSMPALSQSLERRSLLSATITASSNASFTVDYEALDSPPWGPYFESNNASLEDIGTIQVTSSLWTRDPRLKTYGNASILFRETVPGDSNLNYISVHTVANASTFGAHPNHMVYSAHSMAESDASISAQLEVFEELSWAEGLKVFNRFVLSSGTFGWNSYEENGSSSVHVSLSSTRLDAPITTNGVYVLDVRAGDQLDLAISSHSFASSSGIPYTSAGGEIQWTLQGYYLEGHSANLYTGGEVYDPTVRPYASIRFSSELLPTDFKTSLHIVDDLRGEDGVWSSEELLSAYATRLHSTEVTDLTHTGYHLEYAGKIFLDELPEELIDGNRQLIFHLDSGGDTHAGEYLNYLESDTVGLFYAVDMQDARPMNISLSKAEVVENTLASQAIGTLSTFDAAHPSHQYKLYDGADNHLFEIVGDQLFFKNQPDFEERSEYTILVTSERVKDDYLWYRDNLTKYITIRVTDVNEAPTDISLTSSSISENLLSGTTVGSFSTSDADTSDTFGYTLVSGTGSTDNAAFTIVGNELRTNASFNFEAKPSYSIRVRTTDQGGLFFEKTFTITVTNVNEAPTDIALTSSSVSENQPSGTTVGSFLTTDPDVGDSFTYQLINYPAFPDNNALQIVGNELRTNATFDFEVKSSYTIRVRTTDQGGLSWVKTLAINVTQANEAPSDITLSSATIAENLPAGRFIGTFATSDPDAGNSFTYELINYPGFPDNAAFMISGKQLRTNTSFNFEAKSSYKIRVRTTDQNGLSFSKTFIINITNINERPTSIVLSNATIPENSPVNTTVGRFSTLDPDAGNTFTYALVGGTGATDNSKFRIIGNQLRTLQSFDFETRPSYSIRVRTTDQSGMILDQIFTISIINVVE